MQVRVRGANCTVPEGVKREATEKLQRVRKLFDRFIDMEIVFSEDRNPRIADRFHCEVVLHAKGRYLRAEAAGPDFTTTIDRVEARLARQVRKYKTRLVSKSRRDTAHTRDAVNERISAGALH